MMKKIFSLVLAVAMIVSMGAVLVGCLGGGNTAMRSGATDGPIVGEWDWMEVPYYVFDEGGTGTRAGMPIRWSVNDGVLYICDTPDTCPRNSCIAPYEWNYVIRDDELTLSSRQTGGRVFVYTRSGTGASEETPTGPEVPTIPEGETAPEVPYENGESGENGGADEIPVGDLIGTWTRGGVAYFVFNEDGTGTRAGVDIRWTVADGILSICNTLETCPEEDCSAPMLWAYEFDDAELTLSNQILEGLEMTLIRG